MSQRTAVTAPAEKATSDQAAARVKPEQRGEQPSLAQNLLHLQQAVGNRATQSLLSADLLQAKLRIGPAGDSFEREADRMADAVLRMPEPGTGANAAQVGQTRSGNVQRVCSECEEELRRQPLEDEEEEELLQTKASANASSPVKAGVESRIASLRGGGRPLSPTLRSYFEPRFNHDFSNVRVHTGGTAAASARAIKARAFTAGRDIAFGAGQYAPESRSGRQLLAHELTHVAQQGMAPLRSKADPLDLSSRMPKGTISRAVSPQYSTIEKNLTYGIFDWAITDNEATEVMVILAYLSDEDLEDTVQRMEADGLVERLLDNIPDEDRTTFQNTIRKIQGVRSTSQVTAEIEDLMSYGVFDWAITNEEAHRALETFKDLRSANPAKFKQVLRVIEEKYFQRFLDQVSDEDREANKEFLAELQSVRATGLTRADARQAFKAYKALSEEDRRKQFDRDHPTGRISNMLRALKPQDAVDQFEDEVRELLRWTQEKATREASGLSDEEMAKIQSEFMAVRREKKAVEKIEEKRKAEGKPKSEKKVTPTPEQLNEAHEDVVEETTVKQKSKKELEWEKKRKKEKKEWEDRGKAVIDDLTAHAKKKYPELKLKKENFKFDYKGTEERGKRVFARGGTGPEGDRLCQFGKSFVEAAEEDLDYVMSTVVHEVFGHPEFGVYGQEYLMKLYDAAAAKMKGYTQPTGEKRTAEIDNFAYQGTEIYSVLRGAPYHKAVSAEHKKKGITGGGAPWWAVQYRIRMIKQNWDPKLASALVRGLYQRFRNDPRITPESLKLYERGVKREFKKQADSILK